MTCRRTGRREGWGSANRPLDALIGAAGKPVLVDASAPGRGDAVRHRHVLWRVCLPRIAGYVDRMQGGPRSLPAPRTSCSWQEPPCRDASGPAVSRRCAPKNCVLGSEAGLTAGKGRRPRRLTRKARGQERCASEHAGSGVECDEGHGGSAANARFVKLCAGHVAEAAGLCLAFYRIAGGGAERREMSPCSPCFSVTNYGTAIYHEMTDRSLHGHFLIARP